MEFKSSDLTDEELTFMFSATLPLIRMAQGKGEKEVQVAVEIAKGALGALSQSGGIPAYIDKLEAFTRGTPG